MAEKWAIKDVDEDGYETWLYNADAVWGPSSTRPSYSWGPIGQRATFATKEEALDAAKIADKDGLTHGWTQHIVKVRQ